MTKCLAWFFRETPTLTEGVSHVDSVEPCLPCASVSVVASMAISNIIYKLYYFILYDNDILHYYIGYPCASSSCRQSALTGLFACPCDGIDHRGMVQVGLPHGEVAKGHANPTYATPDHPSTAGSLPMVSRRKKQASTQ